MPSQQDIGFAKVAQDFAVSVDKHDCTWESWITSPIKSAIINLIPIACVRVIFSREIPTTFYFIEKFISAYTHAPHT